MSDFRIRAAADTETAVVADLVFSVLREYGLAADPGGKDADLRDLRASYTARGGAFDVLEGPGGAIVGCVGLLPIDRSTCELRKMYLLPSVRGSGLGRRLLDHALARARELGFERVVLETATVLDRAIRLYVSYGFRRYHSEHLSGRCDQAYALTLGRAAADPIVRDLERADLPALLSLYAQLHPDDDPLPPADEVERIWSGILGDPAHVYLGGFVGGALVAAANAAIVANLTRGARPYALIENVITDARYRRRGLGSIVLAGLIERCWERGCYKVMLMSGMARAEIHGFYASLGFDRRSKQAFVITRR